MLGIVVTATSLIVMPAWPGWPSPQPSAGDGPIQ